MPGISFEASTVDQMSVVVDAIADGEHVGSGQLLVQDRGHEWRATFAFELAEDNTNAMVPAALIRWAEVESQTIIQRALAPLVKSGRVRRDLPLLFCVDNPPGDPATAEALAAASLVFTVGQDEMTRPTSGAPGAALPDGLTPHTWHETTAPLFFRTYSEAFRARPGFPNWGEARWRTAFTADAAFRPDLSCVVLDGLEPAAFVIAWVEDGTGWITQMGVREGWRGQGIGEALIVATLRAFAAEGIETAALEVATDNADARALYERMGFRVSASYRSWRKKLA